MLLQALASLAAAADCGQRVTVAPMMLHPTPIVPMGASIRLDATLQCPERRGPSVAISFDLAVGTAWVHRFGTYPSFRQLIAFSIEPAARGTVPGGPYVSPRLGVIELFGVSEIEGRDTLVSVLPGITFGYRYEARSGFTLLAGAGVEGWIPEWTFPLFPVVELRVGYAFGRP